MVRYRTFQLSAALLAEREVATRPEYDVGEVVHAHHARGAAPRLVHCQLVDLRFRETLLQRQVFLVKHVPRHAHTAKHVLHGLRVHVLPRMRALCQN